MIFPAGPPLVKPEKWIAKRETEEKREVCLTMFRKQEYIKSGMYHQRDTEAAAHFDLASSVLSRWKKFSFIQRLSL